MYLLMDRKSTAKIRLYVDHPLGQGQSLPVSRDQAHYLFGVMRLTVGATIKVFDGRSGEWLAEVEKTGKRGGDLRIVENTSPLRMPPDLWLIFAPIKKARTDFIVEKAVELGVSRILPVQTEFTNAGRIQRDRLQAHAVEAAEQCGATYVPIVEEMVRLEQLLTHWDPERRLLFCDEALAGAASQMPEDKAPWSVLIGPEGGFSAGEREKLGTLEFTHPVSLGPRILRADTAAVAALTLWQRDLGDWSQT